MKDSKGKGGFVGIVVWVVLVVIVLSMCDGGGSSGSGRKWSDLSETEKDNARWAYEVQQGLNG